MQANNNATTRRPRRAIKSPTLSQYISGAKNELLFFSPLFFFCCYLGWNVGLVL